jgi:hypothetical protein
MLDSNAESNGNNGKKFDSSAESNGNNGKMLAEIAQTTGMGMLRCIQIGGMSIRGGISLQSQPYTLLPLQLMLLQLMLLLPHP